MSITSGYTKYKRYQKLSDGTYQLVSQWTSSNTVHFDDGATAEAKIATMQTAIDGVNTKVNNLSELSAKQVEVLNERMNTFTALEDGSTTGDAELIDARIDKDGNIHENVGEHIRNITSQLSSENAELKGDIDKLNEGGLNLKDEVIAEDINNWLDEHPEATTTVQDGAITELKIHSNFLAYIKKDYVTPQMFYKDSDNGDWTNAIQSAIDSNAKNSYVFLPIGDYLITRPLTITHDVAIIGSGSESIIKCYSDVECMIYFNSTTGAFSTLSNFKLSSDLNADIECALKIKGSRVYINNIYVFNINGNGVKYEYPSYRVITDVITIHNVMGYGMVVGNSDSFFSNIEIFHTLKHGLLVEGQVGSNNDFANVRCYYTGYNPVTKAFDENSNECDGFYFFNTSLENKKANTCRLVNCEAQECGGNGFSIIDCVGMQFDNCYADSCNVTCGNYGFYISGVLNSIFNLMITNKATLKGRIKTGLYIKKSNSNVIVANVKSIDGAVNGELKAQYFDDLIESDFDPSNKLTINANDYEPMYFKNLFYPNNDGVFTDESISFIQGGDFIAEYSIDYSERCQKIKINDGYTNPQSYVGIESVMSLGDAKKISISVEGKATIISGISNRVRLVFLDNGENEISREEQSIIYPHTTIVDSYMTWNTHSNVADIPSGAVKVKIQLRTVASQLGKTGTFCWRNLKVNLL